MKLRTLIVLATTALIAFAGVEGQAQASAPAVKTQDQVTSYNDGWTDAMASVGLDVNGHKIAGHKHRAPNAEERQELADAISAQPNGHCHLEWDGVWMKATRHHHAHWADAWFEAICQG